MSGFIGGSGSGSSSASGRTIFYDDCASSIRHPALSTFLNPLTYDATNARMTRANGSFATTNGLVNAGGVALRPGGMLAEAAYQYEEASGDGYVYLEFFNVTRSAQLCSVQMAYDGSTNVYDHAGVGKSSAGSGTLIVGKPYRAGLYVNANGKFSGYLAEMDGSLVVHAAWADTATIQLGDMVEAIFFAQMGCSLFSFAAYHGAPPPRGRS